MATMTNDERRQILDDLTRAEAEEGLYDLDQATPRPWQVGGPYMATIYGPGKLEPVFHLPIAEEGAPAAQFVAACTPWLPDGSRRRNMADAALIRRAVNAHEALVEALSQIAEAPYRYCLAGVTYQGHDSADAAQMRAVAKAALAKTKGL